MHTSVQPEFRMLTLHKVILCPPTTSQSPNTPQENTVLFPPPHHWWCLPALEIYVNRIIHTFPYMVFFSQHNFFEIHAHCYLFQWFIPSYCWVISHSMKIPPFVIHCLTDGHLCFQFQVAMTLLVLVLLWYIFYSISLE